MPDVHPLILLAHTTALLMVVIDLLSYREKRQRYTLERSAQQASTQREAAAAGD